MVVVVERMGGWGVVRLAVAWLVGLLVVGRRCRLGVVYFGVY
jgi:hypothetical protein